MTGWDELMRSAEQRHGVVSRVDLLAAGLSEGQIARMGQAGRIVRIGPSSYRLGGAPDCLEARVLGVLWSEDGASQVVTFVRGPWEDEALAL